MSSTFSRTAFLGGSAAAGTALAAGLAPRPASAATQIRVCYIPIVDELPMYVGVDQGFFKKRDLDVSGIVVANQGVLISSLASGSAELGSSVLVSMLPAVEAGIPLVAVAACVTFPVPHNVGVLARTDGGIKTAKDLVGKKVGIPGIKSYFQVMTTRWLAEKGVDASKLTFVEVPPPQTADVLKAGQVDAVVTVDPFFHRIIDQKIGYQFDDFEATVPAGTLIDCYAATKEWAAKNPAAVKAFREGLIESIAYIKKNDASARESLGKWTKQPEAVVAHTAIPNFSVGVNAGQIQWWIDLAKKQGLIAGKVNPKDLLVS
jgi:NitT/TauT family transport system substrate-binding protein